MAQQVHDGHRPIRWDKLQYGRSVSRGRTDAYLNVGKRGDKFGHGIGEREFACIDQHHRCDAGDRLRHRMKRKDRV